MAIVTAEIRFAPQLAAWFTANPTKVLQDGEIVYCSDGANVGKYVIGDNSTQLSALTFYGGISSSGLTIGTTTITSGTNTRILYNNAGVVGEYLVTGTGTTAVLSDSPQFTTMVNIGNAVTTNQRMLRVGQDTSKVDIGSLTTNTALGAVYVSQTTPDGTNYALTGNNNGSTLLNSKTAVYISVNTNQVQLWNAYQIKWFGGVFSGSLSGEGAFMVTPGVATNLTANTEVNNFQIPSYTWTWNTGAFSNTQIFNTINSPTIAFNGASTATLVANFAAKYVQGGTNATVTTSAAIYVPTLALTNTTTAYGIYSVASTGATTNWAAGFSGNVNIIGTPHVSGVAGVDGTFTTVDGKTVTVSKGLITAIV